MKKQRIVIIFTAVLLMFQIFALSGCASDETLKDEDAQVVYYINNAGTGVEAQAYDIISTETGAQIEELVWRLGAIPDKLEYKAPLQMGFSLLSYRVEGETFERRAKRFMDIFCWSHSSFIRRIVRSVIYIVFTSKNSISVFIGKCIRGCVDFHIFCLQNMKQSLLFSA
mgnify:CR=1 FL=1